MNKIISAILCFLFVTSCSRVVVPYHSTVKSIYNLEAGMKLQQVNSQLGIKPYEFYLSESNMKITAYKYKLRYQKVESKLIKDESSLKDGITSFKNEKTIYCIFDKNETLIAYMTDIGRDEAIKILNNENYLKLFLKDPQKFKGILGSKK